MSMNLIAKKSISLKSSPFKVWDALTNPVKIKEWLFGTNTVTDWQVGSPIVFTGEWDGKSYRDQGTILNIVPEKQIRYSYWSSMSGLEDKPENYAHVTYDLQEDNNSVLLTITQDNIATEESRQHSEQNWVFVLENIKKLVEAES